MRCHSISRRVIQKKSNKEGTDLQDTLAQCWGKLQVLFEDDTAQAVYFVNPEDIATYLGAAAITTQTAFGLNYIENFLGLGTVIITSRVTKGTTQAELTAIKGLRSSALI